MKKHARIKMAVAAAKTAGNQRRAAVARQRHERIVSNLMTWVADDLRRGRYAAVAWALTTALFDCRQYWRRFGTHDEVAVAAADLLEQVSAPNAGAVERRYIHITTPYAGDDRGRFERAHGSNRTIIYWAEWSGPVPREQYWDGTIPSGIVDNSYPTVRNGWITRFEGFAIHGGRAFRGYGPCGTPEHVSRGGYIAVA